MLNDVRRQVRKTRRQAKQAQALAKLAADNPEILLDLGRAFLVSRGVISEPAKAAPAGDRTPPAALADFARAASAVIDVPAAPDAAIAIAGDIAKWPDWFSMHDGWSDGAPVAVEPGATFVQRVKIMGIPAEINWTVLTRTDSIVRLDGTGRMGMKIGLFVEVRPIEGGSRIWVDLGLDGDPLRGPMGATIQRAIQETLDASTGSLGATIAGRPAGRTTPVEHRRTGVLLDPRTPVLVGAGQVVQRTPDGTLLDPVALSTQALQRAEADAGVAGLLASADAVFAVASTSWSYADQALLTAQAVGATVGETVMSARFGGDGAQLLVNAAAEAIANGSAEVVLVTGAEAGATLAKAQKDGVTPDWPTQPAGTQPSKVLGSEREANNDAEAAAGLGAPIYMYALIEDALRGARNESRDAHQTKITELWSGLSEVAAENRYAWQPEAKTAKELAEVGEDNRLISSPYTKLLCANLQVDLASGLILTSVGAAEARGISQDKWVFVHAGASAQDEWFVSERADLAASPAIHAIGQAVLGHADIGIEDVTYVDLYACFPSAVQIAASELGLPSDDPKRPLSVTGGLTFGGGPGNNYGSHAVATLVGRLRDDPDAYGLSTSLGWFVTKHAIGIYSARPPRNPYANLKPVVEHPAGRRALSTYQGTAVVEAHTITYGRSGRPESAVVSAITPDGARVLIKSGDTATIEALTGSDPVRRKVTISGTDITLGAARRLALPAPPPAPVLVERRGPVTVITLNRPDVRNAIDHRTALLLERAIDSFEADPGARVAVLTGAGTAFCAGMDLKSAARGEFPITERRGPLGLTGKPPVKPLIAAVEGPALAGGCELALSADLIVASSASTFGIPEAKRGLVAAAGGVLRLAQRLPRPIVLELGLTGEPMTAQRLAELGLINRVVDPGTALDTALALAGQIAANAPLSVAITKLIVDESEDWQTAEAFDLQSELAAPVLMSQDASEGIRAFAEHREPVWTGS